MNAGTSTKRGELGAGTAWSRRTKPRILVVGLGNLLLRDDGVGVHVVRELKGRVPRSVLAVEVGTAVMDALHLLEDADKVLAVDAMEAGGMPGTIYALHSSDVEDRPTQASLHELNLISALHFLRRRPEILILGVEPEVIEFGLELSPSVKTAVPRVVEEVYRTVAAWRPSGN